MVKDIIKFAILRFFKYRIQGQKSHSSVIKLPPFSIFKISHYLIKQ